MGEEKKYRDDLKREWIGVYVHIPFCTSKCIYCDFSSFAGQEAYFKAYRDSLLKEIGMWGDRLGEAIRCDTVYVGGGTPSIFPESMLDEILRTIRQRFSPEDEGEITIEGNPESLTRAKLEYYTRIGFNRISIGFQSLDDGELARIGRLHNSVQALESFRHAREAGFKNVSIDLIAGLPGQSRMTFKKEVEKVVALRPEHVSIYLLESDRETPLLRHVREGRMTIPDEQTMVDFYDEASGILQSAGYMHYEVSNYSLPGRYSRHNMKYWQDLPFIGLGSAAHSYVNGSRYENDRDIKGYISAIEGNGNAFVQIEEFDREKRISEALFMGLRLTGGLDTARIEEKYGVDVMKKFEAEIAAAVLDGLLRVEGDRLLPTDRGIIFSNELCAKFV